MHSAGHRAATPRAYAFTEILLVGATSKIRTSLRPSRSTKYSLEAKISSRGAAANALGVTRSTAAVSSAPASFNPPSRMRTHRCPMYSASHAVRVARIPESFS